MIQRHLPNVLTFFAHHINNAVSEGLNSKIQTIKTMAYGFRNREHFKTAIYFPCGGFDLWRSLTRFRMNELMKPSINAAQETARNIHPIPLE